jgi:hypothetical protein
MNAAFEFVIDGIFIILSIYHAAGVHREYKWELVSLLRCIRQPQWASASGAGQIKYTTRPRYAP